MVCCGASLSITAMSPNCRSASTRTTGLSGDRLARTTARLAASTDLPAPPLVENTVMTWPRSPSPAVGDVGAAVGDAGQPDDVEALGDPRHGRRRAAPASTGRGEDVVHPGAQRRLEQVGGQLVGDQDRADLAVGLRACSPTSARRAAERTTGPSTSTSGPPVRRACERARATSTGSARPPELGDQPVADLRVVVEDGHRHEGHRVGSDGGLSLSEHGVDGRG